MWPLVGQAKYKSSIIYDQVVKAGKGKVFLNTENQLMLPNFILFIEAFRRYGHVSTFVHSAQS